jgi:hypothetical protein
VRASAGNAAGSGSLIGTSGKGTISAVMNRQSVESSKTGGEKTADTGKIASKVGIKDYA